MEDITRRDLMFDFYRSLLTPKQQEVYEFYFLQDFSLGEIAEFQKVSRQAVYDLLKRTEEALLMYEKKLGLVKRYQESSRIINSIREELDQLKHCMEESSRKHIFRQLDKLEDCW